VQAVRDETGIVAATQRQYELSISDIFDQSPEHAFVDADELRDQYAVGAGVGVGVPECVVANLSSVGSRRHEERVAGANLAQSGNERFLTSDVTGVLEFHPTLGIERSRVLRADEFAGGIGDAEDAAGSRVEEREATQSVYRRAKLAVSARDNGERAVECRDFRQPEIAILDRVETLRDSRCPQ
jgi:hypothetical protein